MRYPAVAHPYSFLAISILFLLSYSLLQGSPSYGICGNLLKPLPFQNQRVSFPPKQYSWRISSKSPTVTKTPKHPAARAVGLPPRPFLHSYKPALLGSPQYFVFCCLAHFQLTRHDQSCLNPKFSCAIYPRKASSPHANQQTQI